MTSGAIHTAHDGARDPGEIQLWRFDSGGEGSHEPIFACTNCGEYGWREHFDVGARILDRRLRLPMRGDRV